MLFKNSAILFFIDRDFNSKTLLGRFWDISNNIILNKRFQRHQDNRSSLLYWSCPTAFTLAFGSVLHRNNLVLEKFVGKLVMLS